MNKIKILVADDHNLFRQGLIRLLSDNQDIQVIGEAESCEELYQKYFELTPDIILVDIAMPSTSGIEAVSRIIKQDPKAKALFLSAYTDEDYIYKVIKTGGLALLNKNILDEELFIAIDKVYHGESYFGSYWTTSRLEDLVEGYKQIENVMLNFREEQILKLIVECYSSKDIAEIINIGKKSVDYYRGTLQKKLGLKTQPELIKYGLEYFKPQTTSKNH